MYEDALVEDSPVWAALKVHHDAELAAEARDLEAARTWAPEQTSSGPYIDGETFDRLMAEIEAQDRVIPGLDYRVRLVDADDGRRRKYGDAVLFDECARVADAEPGIRSNTLVSAAYKVGRLVPDGLVDEGTAAGELLDAALASGLGEREARGVVVRGLKAGERNPRQLM